MKTLILGGSFDPIHNGHLQMASLVKEKLKVDKVIFLIARAPRWKNLVTSDDDRLNMLKIALSKYESFEISYLEINSTDEINYTYNTILKYPKRADEELYFLIGGDQLEKLEVDTISFTQHLMVTNYATQQVIAQWVHSNSVEHLFLTVTSDLMAKL